MTDKRMDEMGRVLLRALAGRTLDEAIDLALGVVWFVGRAVHGTAKAAESDPVFVDAHRAMNAARIAMREVARKQGGTTLRVNVGEMPSNSCEFCSTSSGIVDDYQRAIEQLRPGHTPHCNSRFVHGDGHCECGQACACSECVAHGPMPKLTPERSAEVIERFNRRKAEIDAESKS